MSAPNASDPEQALEFETVNITDAPLGRSGRPAALIAIEERTATLLSSEFSNLLRVRTQVELTHEPPVRWQEIAVEREEAGVVNLLEFEQLGGNGILEFEWPAFFAILDRLFGGQSSNATRPARTRLSKVEERVMRRLVHVFARSMETAWRNIVPFTVKHLRIDNRAENTGVAQANDWMMITTYTLKSDDEILGAMKLILPVALLDPIKAKLRAPNDNKKKREFPWEETIRSLLTNVPVDLIAELGRTQVNLSDVLNFKVGDIIRLDQPAERPIVVSVAGVPKYRGDISVHYGNIAIQLRSVSGRPIHSQEHKDE